MTTAGSTGKSSGGYGAMVVPMLRPEMFGALASHAGDALFECCYLPEFPQVARALRDNFDGSWQVFKQRLATADHLEFSRFAAPLNVYAMGCVYSPDPERPGEALIPFETETGRLIDEIWQRWLTHDPVRMAPQHADALRSLRRVYLDAGRRTSGSWTSEPRRSPPNWTSSGWTTRSSCSTASTAASPTAIPGRSANW